MSEQWECLGSGTVYVAPNPVKAGDPRQRTDIAINDRDIDAAEFAVLVSRVTNIVAKSYYRLGGHKGDIRLVLRIERDDTGQGADSPKTVERPSDISLTTPPADA